MSRSAFSIIEGGAGLGQVHTHVVPGAPRVVRADVEAELSDRGYSIKPVVPHEPIHVHVPVLTKAAAIRVACDEAIVRIGLARTPSRPYRCPNPPCYLAESNWNSMVNWAVTHANGYLTGERSLPTWAQMALESGQLGGLMRLTGLGATHDALPGWVTPAIIGGCVLLVLLLMKK